MYLINQDCIKEIKKHKQQTIQDTTGIHRITISQIINGKPVLEKKTVYCITKFLNNNKEIEDYFDYVERDK